MFFFPFICLLEDFIWGWAVWHGLFCLNSTMTYFLIDFKCFYLFRMHTASQSSPWLCYISSILHLSYMPDPQVTWTQMIIPEVMWAIVLRRPSSLHWQRWPRVWLERGREGVDMRENKMNQVVFCALVEPSEELPQSTFYCYIEMSETEWFIKKMLILACGSGC
jgi:hypothetical protein